MIRWLSRKLLKVVQMVLFELQSIVEYLICNWPGHTGLILRRLYYKCRLKHVGRKVIIKPGVRFSGHSYISLDDGCIIDFNCIIFAGPFVNDFEKRYIPNPKFKLSDGEVRIGKGVHLSVGCYIIGNGGVQIGDYCGCAAGTRILSLTNHYASYSEPSHRDVYWTTTGGKEHICYLYGPVVLGRNVGIAMNCILLPGAMICEDSFLALSSVASNGVIPSNSIAAGNPAKRIKERYKLEER